MPAAFSASLICALNAYLTSNGKHNHTYSTEHTGRETSCVLKLRLM